MVLARGCCRGDILFKICKVWSDAATGQDASTGVEYDLDSVIGPCFQVGDQLQKMGAGLVDDLGGVSRVWCVKRVQDLQCFQTLQLAQMEEIVTPHVFVPEIQAEMDLVVPGMSGTPFIFLVN